MIINDQEKVIQVTQWYSRFNCSCPTSPRLLRLLSSLGGGVSATQIRSGVAVSSTTPSDCETKQPIPDRVADIVSNVLLERSLTIPRSLFSIFGLECSNVVFCECSGSRPNYSAATMMVWQSNDDQYSHQPRNRLEVTCPLCSITRYKQSNSDEVPIPLPVYLRRRCLTNGFSLNPIIRETWNAYSALVSASGGCGRGMHQPSQAATFRGSWASLLLVEDNAQDKVYGLDGEFLVSNAVGSCLRLQQRCICSDLMYFVSAATAKDLSQFAFSPISLQILGGGEYLYGRYIIFRTGGPLDTLPSTANKDGGQRLFQQNGGTGRSDAIGSEMARRLSSASKKMNSPQIHRHRTHRPTSNGNHHIQHSMTTNSSTTDIGKNVISIQTMLHTVLSKGAVNRRHLSGSHALSMNQLHAAVDAAVDAQMVGETKHLILPPPQIEELDVHEYIRQLCPVKVTVDLTMTNIGIEVARSCHADPPSFSKLLLPPVCNLLSPPIVSRIAFNRYRLVTGLGSFFDLVSIDIAQGVDKTITLDDRAIYGEFLNLLSTIKENCVTRIFNSASAEVLDVQSNIGVTISNGEAIQRELCSASILSMLASLTSPKREDMEQQLQERQQKQQNRHHQQQQQEQRDLKP